MRDSETMRSRLASASAALLGVAGAVVSLAVAPTVSAQVAAAVIGLDIAVYATVGLLILWRHPGHRVGRVVLSSVAVWGPSSALLDIAVARLTSGHHDLPTRIAATVGDTGRGLGWLVLVLVLPLLFPDGRRSGPPALRRTAWTASTVAVVAFSAAALFVPGSNDLRVAHMDNPIGLPASLAAVAGLMSLLGVLAAVVAVVLAVVTLVRRWRRDDALVRQQVLWFALAFACPALLFPLGVADHAMPWMFGLATLPLPVAIGVAVLQRRLYDVQLAVNRTLTYVVLSGLVAGLYALVVAGVGAMLRRQGAPWLPWVAAGVVAVSFAPLRNASSRP